jgi:hypothetical protein
MCADGIGDPQAGAEIVRVLDAVEDEQERRFVERIEHVVERHVALRRIDSGDDALMPGAGSHRFQAGGRYRQHAHLGELRVRQQVAQTRIVAPGIDIDLAHRTGVVTQLGQGRMKAEDQS